MPPQRKQPPLRLSEFADRDAVYQQLQGHGKQGVLTSRATHEGIEVSGTIPQRSLPPRALLQQTLLSSVTDAVTDDVGNKGKFFEDELRDFAVGDAYKDNIFIQSLQQQRQHQHHFAEQKISSDQEKHNNHYHDQQDAADPAVSTPPAAAAVSSPPKTLGWLHSIIDDFYEFRARQFEIKHSNTLRYVVSDADDKASRMIIPSPISDDVAFHLFEMVSERYGIPSVVAQQCDLILRTAKFYSTRDVTAALFFTLLKTPNFDSNDVRFVVEARKAMRSSIVSQRGVDGVLRWFIPLRVVPYVLRKACEHPWARPVLSKCHSAFEKLLSEQRRHRILSSNQMQMQQQQQQQQRQFSNNGGSRNNTNFTHQRSSSFITRTSQSPPSPPLFTLPAPSKLILTTPFGNDHPLVGRGPFVDIRGNEMFLGSQPQQLVIGADYLLCMLFCNWLDHRDHSVMDVAEGKPIRTIINRQQGKVASHVTITEGKDVATAAKLQMFAMDIDEGTGEFVDYLAGTSPKSAGSSYQMKKAKSNNLSENDEKNNADEVADSHQQMAADHSTMSELAVLAEKYQQSVGGARAHHQQLGEEASSVTVKSGRLPRSHTDHPSKILPARVIHLYTK